MFSAFEKGPGLPNRLILFVGLGNVLRRDDGVGVYVAQKLLENPQIRVLNVEVSLENYIGKINAIHPDVLILMDSVDFKRKPGYSALIPAGSLADYTTNTHNISLARISEFIHARTFVWGIQPALISFGEGLSAPVKRKANLVIKKINALFACE